MKFAIIGGSGFIGKKLVDCIQARFGKDTRIVIYSRSESKQAEMKIQYPEGGASGLRYIVGDVCDTEKLESAITGCDGVFYAAAMKRVDTCEYDPIEASRINVQGAISVVRACIRAKVSNCIMTSTDKAVDPVTLYGATKFCGEKILIASNNLSKKTRFSVARYANVIGSTGSVFEIWENQAKKNQPITVTDRRMTRMFWSGEQAALFLLNRLMDMQGGETFLPDIPGFRMGEQADSIAEKHGSTVEEIGIRPGEKLHESLLNEADARNCFRISTPDEDDFYVVFPEHHDWTLGFDPSLYCGDGSFEKMSDKFRITSEY